MKSGRLVMASIDGTRLDAAQAAFLRRHGIRAVCLFRQNLGSEAEVRRLTADLHDALGPGALIGLDQEGGSVVRVTFVPQPPAAMALGAAGDEALAESVGAATARAVRCLGFNWNFAPVLDVNNNPDNPVIAERSFGADPHAVARLAGAWMRGALREGVACCVKHFPGHGDTHVDSHLELPVVDKPLARLHALELLPFRALVPTAPAVMSAHIVYPQIDPDFPATLSRRILGGLLRDEWGYDGVVITDSLVMKAIYERYGHQHAAVLALQAGADMLMALGTPDEQAATIAAIDAAMADGSLPRERVARANARLDALAARFPSRPGPYTDEVRAHDEDLMRRAWAAALTTVGQARAPRPDRPLRVFTQRDVQSDGIAEAGLSGEAVAGLFSGFADVEVVQLDDLGQLDWAEPKGTTSMLGFCSASPQPTNVPGDGRTSVIVSNVRTRYGEAARRWRPDLHVVLWNPFQVLDVAAPAVVTWGYAPGALEALGRWLRGSADAPGCLPVPLAPATPAGFV